MNEKHDNTADVRLERIVSAVPETETLTLLPGWKFQPFVSADDEINTDGNQHHTKRNEEKANAAVSPWVASEHTTRPICGGTHDGSLQRMIDPLTKPDEEAARGNGGRRWNGKRFKYSGAGKQEDHNTHDHKNLIPVIKCKLGKWIRAVHRLMQGANA